MWPDAHTLAAGLRVPKAYGDFIILDIVRQSGGTAIAVSDDAIMDGVKEMASTRGHLRGSRRRRCARRLQATLAERISRKQRSRGAVQYRFGLQVPRRVCEVLGCGGFRGELKCRPRATSEASSGRTRGVATDLADVIFGYNSGVVLCIEPVCARSAVRSCWRSLPALLDVLGLQPGAEVGIGVESGRLDCGPGKASSLHLERIARGVQTQGRDRSRGQEAALGEQRRARWLQDQASSAVSDLKRGEIWLVGLDRAAGHEPERRGARCCIVSPGCIQRGDESACGAPDH